MLRILVGYKGEHRESAPAVLYAGHDGDELLKVASGVKPGQFQRLTKIIGPLEVKVRFDEPKVKAKAKADADAEAKAKADADAEAEAKAKTDADALLAGS